MRNKLQSQSLSTRRKFIKTTSAAALGGTVAFNLLSNSGHAMNSNTLKVALIGCGGRGTGAANQALAADDNVVLTAVADIFEDHVQQSLTNLKKLHPDKVKVDAKNQFIGFDAYQKVLESDVDVVLLATPPCFRPDHLEAAVKAGKHIFCEKPMAVDSPGVRKVIAASDMAKEKGLTLTSGFCWRYHSPKRETFQKVLAGEIGEVHTIYNTYNTGALWFREVPEGAGDMETKLRNWIYYNWLSGDHIMEQAIHSIDMMSWALNDAQPLKAVGTGGRQVRTEDKFGNVFDHFAIVYEYESGAKGFHFSRQQKDCDNSYAVEIFGSEGHCMVDCIRRVHQIKGKNEWRFKGEDNDMYQQEHDELFASIRAGKPFNDGHYMAQSTMMALMGRMVAYTGQELTYEQALASEEKLGPDKFDWETIHPLTAVGMPGKTKFF